MYADTFHLRSASARRSRFDGPPGLSGELWPVHPHRLDDELLSSWIVRTAHANRIKLQTFTSLGLGRDAALWNRDIDRSAGTALLVQLSAQTGSSVEELRGGMLASYEGVLFERHTANGNNNWILPLGIYHRTRRDYGMQFCPLCLFFDPTPYYRRRWRLSFATICDRHGTMLHDRCPECGAPVIYFRNDLGRRRDYRIGDHTSCWRCRYDLRRASAYGPSAPDGNSIMTLRSLIAFFDFGWWFQGRDALQYGHLFFDALHHLLAYFASGRGQRLLELVEKETGWQACRVEDATQGPFELRPIRARHRLMAAALWLLDDWPERFMRSAKSAKLTQSRILRGQSLPFWFESEIRLNLGAGNAVPTAEEAKAAADFLAKRGKVSSSAVGRLIGTRDSVAAKLFLRPKPTPLDVAEYRHAIDGLNEEIKRLRPRSSKRLILQRDKTIFRLLWLTGWTARKALRLTVADAVHIASTPRCERDFHDSIPGLLLTYLRDTRRYLVSERSGNALFIGWRIGGIGEKDWSLRAARVRRS